MPDDLFGPDQNECRGVIENVTFHNEENGYSILKVDLDGGMGKATVVGKLPTPSVGEEIHAKGTWKQDPKYGRQFDAAELSAQAPGTLKGLEKYLASGLVKGIGPAYAKRIVKTFGHDTLNVIEKHSGRLREVEGVGESRRRIIKASWDEQKSVREIMVFLHSCGLSTNRALRLYRQFGEDAVKKIQEDPYRLAYEVEGIGFHTADDIAKNLGQHADEQGRVLAALRYALEQAALQGHTGLPKTELLADTERLTGLDLNGSDHVENALLNGHLACPRADIPAEALYQLPRFAHGEAAIARQCQVLSQPLDEDHSAKVPDLIAAFEQSSHLQLSEEQKAAVQMATTHRFSIITGGPGVGKTTILSAVLSSIRALGKTVVLCAPTGRAAKRLHESTQQEALTLHRALEFQPGGGFARGPNQPLVGDFFVIDEASMVDTLLFRRFLEALPKQAMLLLVGDADQLPSVGAGNILRDCIESGRIPTKKLTHIYRQAAESLIVQAAHQVQAGQRPQSGAQADSDFLLLPRENPEQILSTLKELISNRIPQKFGLSPVQDIQVLTPMNKNDLGVNVLNTFLQNLLNGGSGGGTGVERFGQTFRKGDKVIQLKNNYDKEIFNGDIGIVTLADPGAGEVHVDFPSAKGLPQKVIYESGELDELRLAYAISIHKSQGSEFPVVIVPLTTKHFPLLQKNLLYTAITRGKKLVVVIAEERALEIALSRSESANRYTGLLGALTANTP